MISFLNGRPKYMGEEENRSGCETVPTICDKGLQWAQLKHLAGDDSLQLMLECREVKGEAMEASPSCTIWGSIEVSSSFFIMSCNCFWRVRVREDGRGTESINYPGPIMYSYCAVCNRHNRPFVSNNVHRHSSMLTVYLLFLLSAPAHVTLYMPKLPELRILAKLSPEMLLGCKAVHTVLFKYQ